MKKGMNEWKKERGDGKRRRKTNKHESLPQFLSVIQCTA